MATPCSSVTAGNCGSHSVTLADGSTIQPCQRYKPSGRRARCRVNPGLSEQDKAAFLVAQQPPPAAGYVGGAMQAMGDLLGGVTGALGGAAQAVGDTVAGAAVNVGLVGDDGAPSVPFVAPTPTPTSFLLATPQAQAEATGLSVSRVIQLRQYHARRAGVTKKRPTKKKRSSRKRISRKRSSRKRSSRRRSSRKRSSRKFL